MNEMLGPLVLLMILVGHAGLHLAIYNRLNATGLTRQRIKQIEKFFLATMIVIPPIVFWWYPNVIVDLLEGRVPSSRVPGVLIGYAGLCLATWVFLGIPWLLWRPIFGLEWVDSPRNITRFRVNEEVDVPLARSTKCKWESRIPFNQLFDLSVEHIRLPVVGLPKQLDGYRIAHLSDIHLTGDIQPEYMEFVIRQANQWDPHLFAMTGDVIDKQPCIDWLFDLFTKAKAPDGCYFVLGNHDTRVRDPGQTRRELNRAGWTDLGNRVTRRELGGIHVDLIGNEHPWFPRPEVPARSDDTFRFLLSHSPDQLSWARKHDVNLMLAGHTHGGQGRLPLIGPLMSPSFHGSRFASGDFYKSPVTLHVSRGLGGVHLLRLCCPPELSLIELRLPVSEL